MEFSQNPVPGQTGNGEQNWGEIVNTILSELKQAANTLEQGLAGKSDSNHTHSGYATATALQSLESRIQALETSFNDLNPNLDTINISASISNGIGVLVIRCNVSPSVYIHRWELEIKKAGNVIVSELGTSNIFGVPASGNFEDGDSLQIRVLAHVGENSKSSVVYAHTYTHLRTKIETEIEEIRTTLSGMTLTDMVTAFKDDENAMIELANYVHTSNLLAQKVAELQ